MAVAGAAVIDDVQLGHVDLDDLAVDRRDRRFGGARHDDVACARLLELLDRPRELRDASRRDA